jgi:hypothetical protein
MGLWNRAERTDRELAERSSLHRLKHRIDRLLPLALAGLVFVLYLEFVAASTHPLAPYNLPIQFAILAYFIAELGVDFLIYEEHRTFFRDRWLDILLTLPFFTAFKGVAAVLHVTTGPKLVKSAKAVKTGKIVKAGTASKAGKTVKVVQKLGKLGAKGKKLVKKKLRTWL